MHVLIFETGDCEQVIVCTEDDVLYHNIKKLAGNYALPKIDLGVYEEYFTIELTDELFLQITTEQALVLMGKKGIGYKKVLLEPRRIVYKP